MGVRHLPVPEVFDQGVVVRKIEIDGAGSVLVVGAFSPEDPLDLAQLNAKFLCTEIAARQDRSVEEGRVVGRPAHGITLEDAAHGLDVDASMPTEQPDCFWDVLRSIDVRSNRDHDVDEFRMVVHAQWLPSPYSTRERWMVIPTDLAYLSAPGFSTVTSTSRTLGSRSKMRSAISCTSRSTSIGLPSRMCAMIAFVMVR